MVLRSRAYSDFRLLPFLFDMALFYTRAMGDFSANRLFGSRDSIDSIPPSRPHIPPYLQLSPCFRGKTLPQTPYCGILG